jgi:hypothetical protein
MAGLSELASGDRLASERQVRQLGWERRGRLRRQALREDERVMAPGADGTQARRVVLAFELPLECSAARNSPDEQQLDAALQGDLGETPAPPSAVVGVPPLQVVRISNVVLGGVEEADTSAKVIAVDDVLLGQDERMLSEDHHPLLPPWWRHA